MPFGRKPKKKPVDPLKKLADELANMKPGSIFTAPPSLSQQMAQLQRQQAAMQRQHYQNYQNSLANLMNQKGIGGSAAAQQMRWGGGYGHVGLGTPSKPKKMNPPKYLEGYQVTIRTGQTVWTVHHYEERVDPYQGRPVRFYYLEDENGRQTREEEKDLRISDAYKPGSAADDKKTKVDFDKVVISDEKRNQILEAIEQIKQHDLIFKVWGFGDTIEKGKGVSMLFYGPPGTGKTLMAQAIANKLGYVLKVISTADIESSAPGEAERNIRKHFKEAKNGKTILLFDECDSLIYNRKGVGPILSAQINELLSQIERFDGITLFTTNRLGTLDEAVNRRLALKLEFEMPSADERVEIWKRMFPEKAPIDKDVDWKRLAGVEVTGGYIKNAVLRAARMAAIEKIPDTRKTIKMEHLVKALKLETESMIDFENAQEEHKTGIGAVGVDAHGNRVVRSSTGRTVERKMKMSVNKERASGKSRS